MSQWLYGTRSSSGCFCVAVWKEGFELGCNKIEKHNQKQIDTDQRWVTLLELKGDYYNWQDAIIVFQWQLTQSLFSSNSRLVSGLVGVSHTNDVTSHKCALNVLLKPVCRIMELAGTQISPV